MSTTSPSLTSKSVVTVLGVLSSGTLLVFPFLAKAGPDWYTVAAAAAVVLTAAATVAKAVARHRSLSKTVPAGWQFPLASFRPAQLAAIAILGFYLIMVVVVLLVRHDRREAGSHAA